MKRGRGRGRGKGARGRGNADRSQNRNFNDVSDPRPAPTRGNPVQIPAAEANPEPPRGNPVQIPASEANPASPKGNPVQIPVAEANPRVNPWQNRSFRDAVVAPPSLETARSSPGGGRGFGGDRGGEGVGRVRGRGRGRGGEYVVRSPTPDPIPSSEPPVEELDRLKLSSTTSIPPSEELARAPRPDEGGNYSIRRPMELLVNHFKVDLTPSFTILHYDFDIKPENPPKPNVRVSKSDALLLRNKLFSEDLARFPMSKMAYDGEKNIYSAVELPTGKFIVPISKGEDAKPGTYVIAINLVNKLERHMLDAYLEGRGQSVPRDILQGMDIIMRENPSRTRIAMGRGFYSRRSGRDSEIGAGIIGCRGFQQSLKPTHQRLSICIDYSVVPFCKPVPVLEFLKEHLNIDRRWKWNDYIVRDVEKALKGLKVTVTHRKTTQKFPVVGLTKINASHITFDLEDPKDANLKRKVTLEDYFRKTHNKKIENKHLPCLDLSKNKRMNYVPMEFCVLVEGQRYPKDDLPDGAAKKLKRMSLLRPVDRKWFICDSVNAADGPLGGEIARQFGITVSKEMTKVTSRVLSPPALKLGNPPALKPRSGDDEFWKLTPEGKCQYNFVKKRVLVGQNITRWGILDFSQGWNSNPGNCTPLDRVKFIRAFVQRFINLGIDMKGCLFNEVSHMDVLSNVKELSDLLRHVLSLHGVSAEDPLQFLLCPMAGKHPGYKNLKRICEIDIGVMTQCCLTVQANKCEDQYLANVALKINAKVGGSNMELWDPLLNVEGDGHVMLIGADVNHPTAGQKEFSPSITSVVATMNWPAANRYASRLKAQPRAEKIRDIGGMCAELLQAYECINGVKPEKIIFFRDGVSESQFDMVLNEELTEIKRAIESDGYKPTITLVVAQKRHLTRLFPMNEREVGDSGNIEPGTVVDKIIIHPKEFDFYLNSHYGSIGTSRPTHYHVLWDDHLFSSDQLQRLIYNLCYTFPRCTKPISLVPPVYYADLVAYRGRMYYESLTDSSSPASTASSSSVPSSFFDFPKVHIALENSMICI